MGFGFLVIEGGWKIVSLAAYVGIYEPTPLRLSPHDWWTWVVLFLADDFVYYLYHRTHHEIRMLWASHVVHHSSERYNLSTALRQTWTPFTALPFWLPLAAIGIPPWMILLEQSISLIYQFFLHTERIDKLPRPIEFVLNTPSHHRVHHGSNAAVPRPQLRRHPHHLGPAVRQLRAGRRAGALRADQEPHDVQPGARRVP